MLVSSFVPNHLCAVLALIDASRRKSGLQLRNLSPKNRWAAAIITARHRLNVRRRRSGQHDRERLIKIRARALHDKLGGRVIPKSRPDNQSIDKAAPFCRSSRPRSRLHSAKAFCSSDKAALVAGPGRRWLSFPSFRHDSPHRVMRVPKYHFGPMGSILN
jgi:hypothetical protein